MEEENEVICPECKKCLPGWLQTFADMCTLLLTFFVLLLSFANTDLIKYKEALGSIKDAFGVSVEEPGEFEGKSPNPLALEVPAARTRVIKKEIVEREEDQQVRPEKLEEMKDLARDAKKAVEKTGMKEYADVKIHGDKILIRAKGRVFFDPGKAKIRKMGYAFLKEIGRILRKYNYDLTVEGHTDSLPIKTRLYPSNWELSSSRASSVVRYFIKNEKVIPVRLTAIGHADSRPIAPNRTKAGRAKNRRVEFLFSESKRPQKYNKRNDSDREQKEVF